MLDDGRSWVLLAFATLGVSDALHRRAAREEMGRVAGWPLLFVYGTLRREGSEHEQLEDAVFVETTELPGFRHQGPTLIPSVRATAVGELYRVNPEIWPSLDAWEGSDGWRRRSVRLTDGHSAFVYLKNGGR
jgi:gamma-glutamylcyclotransferase (GGCT)/AIG2-like uncharacterized protein YtfP